MVFLPSGLKVQPRSRLGTTLAPVMSKNNGLSAARSLLPFSMSLGPMKPRRQVPPYLPMLRSGLITMISLGSRSATGGSLPAFTSSASTGASWNDFGHCASSVTITGASIVPTRAFCWAPAGMGSAERQSPAAKSRPAKAGLPGRVPTASIMASAPR